MLSHTIPSAMAQTNNNTHRTSTNRRHSLSRSPPGSSHTNNGNNGSRHKSRLHLMAATGFAQEHEMKWYQRFYKFIRLPNLSEYFMSVDHHQIWRRHLAWSLRDGDHLRNAVTSRFASNMVFMSLLLGTEIGVLFSPSKPADTFRAALKNESYGDTNFWAAIILCISIGLTLSTLVANFTAWAIIGAVSPHNSHAILRSSVGLDAAQLPARLVILSIYCFLIWVMLFIWILLPPIWGYVIALFPVALIIYIVILYSSFGRLVIYSRAMQQQEIFTDEEDVHMSSKRLFEELIKKAEKEKRKQSPLPLYYRSRKELHKHLSDLRVQEQEEFVDMGFNSAHATTYVNQILDSSGHYDVPISVILSPEEQQEMMRNDDEGCNGNNREGVLPQSTKDTEFPPENDALSPSDHREASDTFGDLSNSSRSLRRGSDTQLLRMGMARSGYRRGVSDSGGRQGRMGRMKGESSRNLFHNNQGATTTVALTL